MAKKTIKYKKTLLKLLIFVISLTISIGFARFIVLNNLEIDGLEVLEDDYLLNMIGVLMGLSIAIVTFLFSVIEKIRSSLNKIDIKSNKEKKEINAIEETIDGLFSAIMKDTMFVFFLFVLLLLTILTKGLETVRNLLLNKEIFISIKLVILFLALIALFDIIASLFKIIKGYNLLLKR